MPGDVTQTYRFTASPMESMLWAPGHQLSHLATAAESTRDSQDHPTLSGSLTCFDCLIVEASLLFIEEKKTRSKEAK